ncbi:MAG TPA: sialidase family protein, partial [Thermoplasmata archaeon]
TSTSVPNPTAGNHTCTVSTYFGFTYHYCYNSTTEPSLNLTSQGYTGLAYTAFTNNSPCQAASPYAYTEVGFVTSTDFGVTWTNPKYLGNPVCTGVPDQNYSSAFQPSLTSLANGTFVLSYVEYNSSNSTGYYSPAPPNAPSCGTSNASRIVVTESYDNGGTWTTPHVLTAAEFNGASSTCPMDNFPSVRPRIAAIGDTVYVTWFNMTAPPPYIYYYGSVYSESSWFAASSDGGLTWTTPTSFLTIPSNIYGTLSNVAANPSVMVDPAGEVFVAYATNFGTTTICDQYCGTYYSATILIATSVNNGTTFSYSHAADGVLYTWTNAYPPTFHDPMPSLAYNPVFDQVYLTYSGAVEGNYCINQGPYGVYCYQQDVSNVFFQNSSDHGLTWSNATQLRPVYAGSNWESPAYNPSMAVDSSGRVHLQYAYEDESICANITVPYVTYYCAPTQEIYVNSTDNGTTWTKPLVVSGEYSLSYGPYREIWDGTFTSTLALGSDVLLGWTRVLCPSISTSGCYLPAYVTAPTLPSQSAQVIASRLYLGVGLTLTFNSTTAPVGTIWTVNIMGNIRAGPA